VTFRCRPERISGRRGEAFLLLHALLSNPCCYFERCTAGLYLH
ncbi:uncharacterized protein METZ01_LOCUS418357, partial [marine metagenome]